MTDFDPSVRWLPAAEAARAVGKGEAAIRQWVHRGILNRETDVRPRMNPYTGRRIHTYREMALLEAERRTRRRRFPWLLR